MGDRTNSTELGRRRETDQPLRDLGSIDNLGDLYLLVQAVEAGSFSAAADRLGTTRSLLSRRIMALEDRLGARLLHRNARQFSVTATGERVYRYAAAMVEAAMAAEQAALATNTAHWFIRIEAHGLLSPLAAVLMAEFATEYPAARFAITVGGDMGRLVRQQTDVILGLGERLPDSTDVVARTLGGMRRVTVASPVLVERLGGLPHPGELADADCLALGSDGAAPWHFRGLPPRRRNVRVAFGDAAALLAAVEGGLGVAQLPHYLVADGVAAGRLAMLFEAHEPEPVPLHALTVTGRVAGDATMAFVRFIQGRLPALLA
jgi:DNA-binding transcriptional LysR family regulator